MNTINNGRAVSPPLFGASGTGLSQANGTMSEVNKAALRAVEAGLKANVRLDSGLMDRINQDAGGFLNSFEELSVREEVTDTRKREKLLSILRDKGDSEFRIFVELLRESGNLCWAMELEKRVRQFAATMAEPAEQWECYPRKVVVVPVETLCDLQVQLSQLKADVSELRAQVGRQIAVAGWQTENLARCSRVIEEQRRTMESRERLLVQSQSDSAQEIARLKQKLRAVRPPVSNACK
ncbi:MAG: hypothetical protein OXC07_00085 [Kistimonas sp.]|nr:hypothetical protein [Kistimonas sp.]